MYASVNYEYLHENRRRQNAFAPMFKAKDGYVGAMFRQQNWAEFCDMMGRPEFATDAASGRPGLVPCLPSPDGRVGDMFARWGSFATGPRP